MMTDRGPERKQNPAKTNPLLTDRSAERITKTQTDKKPKSLAADKKKIPEKKVFERPVIKPQKNNLFERPKASLQIPKKSNLP
jgi:hypothetical protein